MSISNQPCGRREALAIKRNRALELRISGKSYRAIAAEMGIGESSVREYVKHSLEKLAEREMENASALRTLELERLDKMLVSIQSKIDEGDTRAGQLALQISESRRRLIGLDTQADTFGNGQLQVVITRLEDTPPKFIESEVIDTKEISEPEEATSSSDIVTA